jgi:hypothetical protein
MMIMEFFLCRCSEITPHALVHRLRRCGCMYAYVREPIASNISVFTLWLFDLAATSLWVGLHCGRKAVTVKRVAGLMYTNGFEDEEREEARELIFYHFIETFGMICDEMRGLGRKFEKDGSYVSVPP